MMLDTTKLWERFLRPVFDLATLVAVGIYLPPLPQASPEPKPSVRARAPEARKPERNPQSKCPTCACQYLYTDYYDQCYGCGRNIGSAGGG